MNPNHNAAQKYLEIQGPSHKCSKTSSSLSSSPNRLPVGSPAKALVSVLYSPPPPKTLTLASCCHIIVVVGGGGALRASPTTPLPPPLCRAGPLAAARRHRPWRRMPAWGAPRRRRRPRSASPSGTWPTSSAGGPAQRRARPTRYGSFRDRGVPRSICSWG